MAECIAENERFTKKQIEHISKQILDALDALHRENIIHRDVKPDNIIIDKSGHAWLIDYDISRIYRAEIRKDTELKGTFGYAPIEQYGMLPTDFKTDIFSFGVTLKAMLDASGVKGKFGKIADKCRRLDPLQRYESVYEVKKAFSGGKNFVFIAVLTAVIAVLGASAFFLWNADKAVTEKNDVHTIVAEGDSVREDSKESDDSKDDLIRFTNTMVSGGFVDYSDYENLNTAAIFSGKSKRQLLSLMSDNGAKTTISMGRNHGTSVEAEMYLYDGVFTLYLKDEFGHEFSHDFYYDNNHSFEIIYPENRRVNAELTCRDMDGDGVEELLVGIADCSFTVAEKAIYPYFNYCMGWVVRYDEARGFILCDGVMFSENSKFVLVDDDLRIYLASTAVNTDELHYYILNQNRIIPYL